MKRAVVLAALLVACGGTTAPPTASFQLIANNPTSDTLIVWWWWKDVRSANLPGDPIVLPPNAGWSPCINFVAESWAQIDGAQGSHDRNSSAGDWRDNTITIDPVRPSFWIVQASPVGQPPTVSEQPSRVC